MTHSTLYAGAPAVQDDQSLGQVLFNKVPEITAYFWIIKVLATTVGETAADFLNEALGLGLSGTSVIMAALLAAVLVLQFRQHQYKPGTYWLAVVLISVVGTLITDNLVDNFGVSLQATTLAFAGALALTFAIWYAAERTLSIHTIYTARREAFYWLAILFTFALGTAAGDLMAESLGLGYAPSALIFAGLIGLVALAYKGVGMNGVLSFWLAYILTRPLGASIGDYLSQPVENGGLDLGTVITSGLFLGAILALVIYLTMSRIDLESARVEGEAVPVHSYETCDWA
tara:strand:+ start:742 stop:1602 length:861 start_codon:yes stop_codon:yes gene_type:complete